MLNKLSNLNPWGNSSNSNGKSDRSNNNGRSRQNNKSGGSRHNYNGRQNNGNNYYNNYNPYADNGRQSKYKYNNTQNSHGHGHKHQAYQQTYVNNQMQQTAQTQTFIEQVDDTVLCISLAGKGYQRGQDADTVDLLCDAAVVSLNMFAVSCEQLHQEKNKDALDLGRKRVHDKFAELKSKNGAVYELIEPHRNFIAAALNGQKNLRYKEDRTEPGVKELFERDPEEINKAFAHMIHQQQKFDKSREALLEQKTNEKLAKQHRSELNDYRRKSGKYRNNSGSKSHKPRAQIKDLYFTKSGKAAKFVDVEAVERAKNEEKAMDEDLFGSGDVYDDILPKMRFMNAALKLSKQNKWNGRSKPMPCEILVPSKKERERQDKNIIIIRPCYPWNISTLKAPLALLEIDEDEVKQIENKHIAQLKKHEPIAAKQNLGYKSIEEQERELDIDFEEESNDDQDMDGDSDSNI